MSIGDVIALIGLAATVVIAGLSYAYKSGRVDSKLEALAKSLDDIVKASDEKAVARETRLGAAESKIETLFDFKARTEGAQEERTRQDTRGVPIRDGK